jgi:hypothetical protein
MFINQLDVLYCLVLFFCIHLIKLGPYKSLYIFEITLHLWSKEHARYSTVFKLMGKRHHLIHIKPMKIEALFSYFYRFFLNFFLCFLVLSWSVIITATFTWVKFIIFLRFQTVLWLICLKLIVYPFSLIITIVCLSYQRINHHIVIRRNIQ